MDENKNDQYGMGYGSYESSSQSNKEYTDSYPPLELNDHGVALSTLTADEPNRFDEIDSVAFSPEEKKVPEYGVSTFYDTPPAIAYTGDVNRASLHPLGNAEAPVGISPVLWSSMDSDSQAKRKRSFVLRQEPVFIHPPVRSVNAVIELPAPPAPPVPAPVEKPAAEVREEKHDPSEMPFLDHLEEFRWVILKSVIAIIICMIGSWYLSGEFYKQIIRFAESGGKSILTGKQNPINIELSPIKKGGKGEITGFIKDSKTGQPIDSAIITATPGGITATTDSVGQYTLKGLGEGTYTITAVKDGYAAGSRETGLKLVMNTVMEPVMITLQMALVMGLVLALPFVFYFIWSFVSPGLYGNEKRWILPLIFASTACFLIGSALAYYLVIPYMLPFLMAFKPGQIQEMLSFSKFMGFIIKVTLSFGIIFELPMVSFVLAKIGILKYKLMTKYRGYAIILIFMAAAIITPTVDPVSQCLMAIPMYILYEISILVAMFAGRKTLI
jgi:Tat protein translocase TatC